MTKYVVKQAAIDLANNDLLQNESGHSAVLGLSSYCILKNRSPANLHLFWVRPYNGTLGEAVDRILASTSVVAIKPASTAVMNYLKSTGTIMPEGGSANLYQKNGREYHFYSE